MSCKITTIIITKNNENSIKTTLESVKDLGPILVGDLNSNDSTRSVLEKFDSKVYKVDFDYDYSKILNNLAQKVTTEWILWLKPGEIISSGSEYFSIDKTDPMYRIMLLQDDLLLKETRLFKKGTARFIKPVFEILDPDLSKQTLPIVIVGNADLDQKLITDCLLKWKDREPLSPEPYYYRSISHLISKRYTEFINLADRFLFLKKEMDISVILTKYYLALLIKKTNVGKSIKLILECISVKPLMAEFWCLLGDIYLSYFKAYDIAYQFYENAMILGSQRLAEDTMPMEISKYDEYPTKMINAIKQTIQKVIS